MESSATREYPSLIHIFFVPHTVNEVFTRDEDRAIYEEMLRLHALGSNSPSGVPYTKEEINALARKGKQRGHLLGVGRAKEDPAVKRYQALKRKPRTEAQARKNMMLYLKNVAGFKMDYFKRVSYDDIRPIFEAKFNSNVAFLQKTKEQIDEKESRALKRINETPAEKASKRKKLDEDVEELKRHLQIVPNKDDDVYTKATPLAGKVPVVGYEIIRADESKKCTWSNKTQELEAVGIL
nr:hypothetical protein [Tanacetum cinerariifolium]